MLYKRELQSRKEEVYELIKSKYEGRRGFRRIAKSLRDMNIETALENVFNNNKVFVVLKRYEERQVRLREQCNGHYKHK